MKPAKPPIAMDAQRRGSHESMCSLMRPSRKLSHDSIVLRTNRFVSEKAYSSTTRAHACVIRPHDLERSANVALADRSPHGDDLNFAVQIERNVAEDRLRMIAIGHQLGSVQVE